MIEFACTQKLLDMIRNGEEMAISPELRTLCEQIVAEQKHTVIDDAYIERIAAQMAQETD